MVSAYEERIPTIAPTDPSPEDTLISEREVLRRWPVLSLDDLRGARKSGRITWVAGKRGSAWYRPSAIQAYISEFKEHRCLARERMPCSSLATNGSAEFPEARHSTVSGLTQEMEERVAQASAQRILKKRS